MNDITHRATTAAVVTVLPSVLNALAAASQLTGVAPSVGRYLELASVLVTRGGAAYASLMALKSSVQTMVAENRQPTDEEWKALEDRSEVAHAAIQEYDVDAEAEQPAEESV